ncbi:MAG: hypothetical protein SFZ24_03810 [Planctomycetota bacterium]|nr:hypothetical protein [Planctomycetota bacterium]
MTRPTSRTLVIADGGIQAFVAAALHRDRSNLTLWIPPMGWPLLDDDTQALTPAHAAAVAEQADFLTVERIIQAPPLPWTPHNAAHWTDPALLLVALERAAAQHCAVVDWPTVCGGDVPRLARADELARLATRLAWASAGSLTHETPSVALPVADLTPVQLCELFLDLDLPAELLWWSTARTAEPSDPADAARWTWGQQLRDVARTRGYPVPAV